MELKEIKEEWRTYSIRLPEFIEQSNKTHYYVLILNFIDGLKNDLEKNEYCESCSNISRFNEQFYSSRSYEEED